MQKSQEFNYSLYFKSNLVKRFFFVIVVLSVYRVGTYVPLFGVNLSMLNMLIKYQTRGVLDMFNILSGGALGRMSIFSLNIMPYITSSIIIQLLTFISKDFMELRKSGEVGRRKINKYSKYLSIIFALLQSYGIIIAFESIVYNGVHIINHPGFYFKIVNILSLTAGTMTVIWLADQINLRGIGNGSSLIIFTSIISGLMPSIFSLLAMGKNNMISIFSLMILLIFILLMIIFVVLMEKVHRKLLIQYPRKQVSKKIYLGDAIHLPIKVNISGVISPVFSNTILLFPTTIISFSKELANCKKFVESYLSQGKFLYICTYVVFIFFFCFFYSAILFNPEETAKNLRKNGAVIIGRRPGKQTQIYLQYVLTRVTIIGALYLSLVCVMPEIFIRYFNMPFYLSGISILIVINVILDLHSQVNSCLITIKYTKLMNSANIMRHK